MLDGVCDRPCLKTPVPRLALLFGGRRSQGRPLVAGPQHLDEISQRERGVRGECVFPAAGALIAPLEPLVEAVLAEGMPAGGLARPLEVLHADGTCQDVCDSVKVNVVAAHVLLDESGLLMCACLFLSFSSLFFSLFSSFYLFILL